MAKRVPAAGRTQFANNSSAAPRGLDRGDVDFLHIHHRIERAFCFSAAGSHRLYQHARRDLPGDAPFVLAPAARAFLAAIADDGIPVAVGLLLIVGRDLKREGFVMFERGPAIEAETWDAGDREFRPSARRPPCRTGSRWERGGRHSPSCWEKSWRRSGLQPRRPCRTRGRSCSWQFPLCVPLLLKPIPAGFPRTQGARFTLRLNGAPRT
jgi:hypothetical protein